MKLVSVICNTCGRPYSEVLSATQARACAATASISAAPSDRHVTGHYGSQYDLQRFKLGGDTVLQEGIVCDACIAGEISSGRAVKDELFSIRLLLPPHMVEGATDAEVLASYQAIQQMLSTPEKE
mgnify:FL=1